MLATYDACSRKFYYEYLRQLASYATSPDLHAGGAFARGIEVARTSFWFANQSPGDAVLEGFTALMQYWGDYVPPDKLDYTSGRFSPHAKDFVNTSSAYFDYFREYPLDTDPIKPYMLPGDRPAVEFTFAIPLPILNPQTGDPLLYGGRCDLLGYYQNLVAIVDEKTATSLGNKWADKWKMRGQFIGYTWAARTMNIPVEYAVIRGVAIQKTQIAHMQAIEHIPEFKIERWEHNMLLRVQRMVDDYKRGYWELSYGDACTSYWGCPFADPCSSRDPEDWLGDFATREWNPLDRDPTNTRDKREHGRNKGTGTLS